MLNIHVEHCLLCGKKMTEKDDLLYCDECLTEMEEKGIIPLELAKQKGVEKEFKERMKKIFGKDIDQVAKELTEELKEEPDVVDNMAS